MELEASQEDSTTIPLILWDSYIQYAVTFDEVLTCYVTSLKSKYLQYDACNIQIFMASCNRGLWNSSVITITVIKFFRVTFSTWCVPMPSLVEM